MGFLKWGFLLSFLAVVLSADLLEFPDTQVKIDQNKLLQYLNNKQELFKIIEKFPTASTKKKTAIVNEFSDKLIKGINDVVVQLGVDPVEIPGFEKEFRVLLVKGWVKLEDGELRGISSIERRGNIKVEYEFPNLTLKLICGLEKLRFDYRYEAKLMGLGPSGRVEGKSDGSKFTVDLTLNLTNLRLEDMNFRLNSIGNISIKFTGSITGQIINILSKVVIPFLRPIIRAALDLIIGGGLSLFARIYNDMICTLLGDCSTELLNGLY